MDDKIKIICNEMIRYYQGDPKRIQHFLKVHSFAKLIGINENIDGHLQYILELAAILHDIGIKVSEEKYRSCSGIYQQIEGPPLAKEMLINAGCNEEIITRVCYLIAHHHTYTNIEGLDYQILVEADFLVNIYEENYSFDQINSVLKNIFKTQSGTVYLQALYLNKK